MNVCPCVQENDWGQRSPLTEVSPVGIQFELRLCQENVKIRNRDSSLVSARILMPAISLQAPGRGRFHRGRIHVRGVARCGPPKQHRERRQVRPGGDRRAQLSEVSRFEKIALACRLSFEVPSFGSRRFLGESFFVKEAQDKAGCRPRLRCWAEQCVNFVSRFYSDFWGYRETAI